MALNWRKEEILYFEGGQALELVAQRGGGYPMHGNI